MNNIDRIFFGACFGLIIALLITTAQRLDAVLKLFQ